MRIFLLIAGTLMAIFLSNLKVWAMELSGTLVISTGQRIETLDLKTLERRMILKDQWPSQLSKIDDNRVLMASDTGIHELDLKTNTVKKIREGYSPQYVPEHRKIFFTDRSISDRSMFGKESPVLFVADIDEPENAEEIKVPPPRKYNFFGGQVIQVSRDEVVFRYDDRIWVYNINSKVVKELPIESCSVLIGFRSATGKLLCINYHEGSEGDTKFLVDLNGGNVEEIPRLVKYYPSLYLPKFDALVFMKKRLKYIPILKLGETADLWVYNFKDGSETFLNKGIWAGIGSAVWVE